MKYGDGSRLLKKSIEGKKTLITLLYVGNQCLFLLYTDGDFHQLFKVNTFSAVSDGAVSFQGKDVPYKTQEPSRCFYIFYINALVPLINPCPIFIHMLPVVIVSTQT